MMSGTRGWKLLKAMLEMEILLLGDALKGEGRMIVTQESLMAEQSMMGIAVEVSVIGKVILKPPLNVPSDKEMTSPAEAILSAKPIVRQALPLEVPQPAVSTPPTET